MNRPFFLLLCWPLLAWATPQLDLDVRLDPASRQLQATAILNDEQGLTGFRLGQEFEITAFKVDGVSAKPNRRSSSRPAGADFYRLPAGTRQIELSYRATLAPTPALDHRQVLGQRAGTAGLEGSFLPGGAGWYPDPGTLFRYRVKLTLPAGQKGLVPGTLMEENASAAGYLARFDFPHPADSIDLMAGPYTVSERSLNIDGKTIRLRTWFHPELADLAAGYLDDSARYLERYSKLIGTYPFASFSIVSSPTPTGFGMPSLTYLGRDVIKLPFIRATSLGHEVLHNWWGNGVYPDWQSGNWSEGLTTFLADYAYKEDEGERAARDMRLGWLRDYAAVPPGEDFALKDFTSRHHGIASIVGYNKAAMVFLMLRDRIGRDAFERGLRRFWQRHQFRTASWTDLENAFSTAAGQSQAAFFRQWIAQKEASPATAPDPDYRVWRRLDPAELPPILREVFIAPQVQLVLADSDADVQQAARTLAARLLDGKELTHAGPRLVIGRHAGVEHWLIANGLPTAPPALRNQGTAQVWAGRDALGRPYVVIHARDAAALAALARPLPHYGKQGWLVFDGSRVIDKGISTAGQSPQ